MGDGVIGLGYRVVFSRFLSKYGVDAGMAVRTILLYVVIYCMFTMSLRCCLYHCAETRLRMGQPEDGHKRRNM